MFELEIMVTGYTIVVASTAAIITKYIGKRKLETIRLQLNAVQAALLKAEAEIERLRKEDAANIW